MRQGVIDLVRGLGSRESVRLEGHIRVAGPLALPIVLCELWRHRGIWLGGVYTDAADDDACNSGDDSGSGNVVDRRFMHDGRQEGGERMKG